MPHIHTIEDNFDYQAKCILSKFIKDNEVEDHFKNDASEAAWKYRREIGEYFINAIEEYCGMDAIVGDIDLDTEED